MTLQYLVSWRWMGVARIRCNSGCTCDEQDLDAHRIHRDQSNVTVFTEHRFELAADAPGGSSEAQTACGLSLSVLPETSSGGHVFKVRDLVIFTNASPCEGSSSWVPGKLRLIERRNNLRCVRESET